VQALDGGGIGAAAQARLSATSPAADQRNTEHGAH